LGSKSHFWGPKVEKDEKNDFFRKKRYFFKKDLKSDPKSDVFEVQKTTRFLGDRTTFGDPQVETTENRGPTLFFQETAQCEARAA